MKPFEQRYVGYYLDLVRSDPEDWRSITAELGQIRRAWELAAQDPGLVLGFVEALRPYQDRQGLWREELAWWQGHGLAAARALGLRRDEATLLNNIGTTYRSLGDLQNAADYYLQSLKIFKELDDTVGQAALLHNVGTALHASGDLAQALHCYRIALPMRRAAGDKAGEASTLNNIGSVYSEMDEPQQALEHFTPALSLREQLGDTAGQAAVLNNIGLVHENLGDLEQALDCYEQALRMDEAQANNAGLVDTLYNIAGVHYRRGNLAEAEHLVSRVMELGERIRHANLPTDRAILQQLRAARSGEIAGMD